MMAGVLDGVRVLDMGRYIAGPLCSALLGDLGAEVIRIERVGGGEDRTQFPTSEDSGANFLAFNRNKLGITLDPASPQGREVMRRLVKSADMLVVNLPLPSLMSLGLDYDTLRQINPEFILIHTSAYGNDGPYADRVGFDGIGQAMCGATYLSGFPDHPIKSAVAWVDCTTALYNTVGALAALIQKRASGQGTKVETNLLRSALTVANGYIIEQAVKHTDRQAQANRLMAGGPGDIVKTKDGWILVQVVSDTLFRRWCKLVGAPELAGDPRFASDGLRGGPNGEMLSEMTREWAAELTTEEALAALAAAKVPGGPVLSPQQALDDPHVQATGMLRGVAYPGIDTPILYAESGPRLGGQPAPIRPPPTIGQHTDYILSGLGYTTAEIAAMRDAGVC
jgi:crotonobetainyl-CoA:carnitine CoA-transferase CaiB-like acyl-CoA transferase